VLRIFGCPAYVHVQSGECSKLDSKLRKCICLGLSNVKGYRIWDLVSEKGNFRRDVVLDEVYMLRKAEDEASTNSQKGKLMWSFVYQNISIIKLTTRNITNPCRIRL
jgi:DNA primase catalytic subunit